LNGVQTPKVKNGQYTVIKGDSAVGIALKFNIKLRDLYLLNPDQDWAKLRIGQQVKISE
jgi:LysM repeat protein